MRFAKPQSPNVQTFLMPWILLCGLLAMHVGCASNNYRYGRLNESLGPISSPAIAVQQDLQPHPKMDRIQNSFDRSINRIRVWWGRPIPTPEQVQANRAQAMGTACVYLQQQGLDDVYVETQTYQPGQQWQRLKENQRIHPVWKYTGGSLSVLSSTIFPPRLFRRDSYNPFTNTLSLNSQNSASSLSAAADVRLSVAARYPGVRAMAGWVPIVPVKQSIDNANEILSFTQAEGDFQFQRQLYPFAYRLVGRRIVLEAIPFTLGGQSLPFYATPALGVAGGAIGAGVGNVVADQWVGPAVSDAPRSRATYSNQSR